MTLEPVARDGIVLLGCGKMGSALLAGWLAAGLPPSAVWVLEPHPTDWLKGLGVHLNQGVPPKPAVALLAVKPQMMGEALPSLQALGNGSTLMVSIAAGTTIATFERAFGDRTPIVRTMPNIPAMVGRGMTGICANTHAGSAGLTLAAELMRAVGEVVILDGEHQIDAITGVSGSGPGFVFYMIEALAAAGEAQGLSAEVAMKLARATVAGAGELAHRSDETAAQLRINVTSPGGTTAAGLALLMDPETGLAPLMRRVVTAATMRGRELAK